MVELEALHRNAIVVLTLKRPSANVLTPRGLLQLQDTVGRLNADARMCALVVTGDGSKFFSAGADLNTFADGDRDIAHGVAAHFDAAFGTLQSTRPMVIAAINGFAMGGGLEYALACDIRVVEAHARLAVPETTVGLLCCGCDTQTLPWLVGEDWAKRVILIGERVDAQIALRIGLAEEIVEMGVARETATAMALRVATLSPQVITFSRQFTHQTRNGMPHGAALAAKCERLVDLSDYPDQREGVNAFLEERAPRWHSTYESGT